MKKFYIFFLSILGLFTTNIYADAVVSGQNSNWQLWYFGIAGDKGNSKYSVSGATDLYVKSTDNSPVSLYLGINVNQDNNFILLNSKSPYFGGNIFLQTELNSNNLVQIGYLKEENTKSNILDSRGYQIGLPSSTLYGLYHNDNTYKQGITYFDGAYIEANNALGIKYKQGFLSDSLKIAVSYIPNLKNNMTNNNNIMFKQFNNALSAVDISVNYYNEYNDIGYGILGSSRSYVRLLANKGNEVLISPNFDYLGFGVMASLLSGNINYSNVNINYIAREFILNYSVLKFNFSTDYSLNTVHNQNLNDYSIKNLTFNINYNFSNNLNLKLAVFNNEIKHTDNAKGIALGFNIKL